MATTRALDWQVGEGQTVGAVTTDLLTIAVPTNSNINLKARVQILSAAFAGGAFELNGSFSRGAGGPAADNTSVSLSSILNATLATASLAYVVSGNNIIIRGTGIIALTINWMAEAKINIYTP